MKLKRFMFFIGLVSVLFLLLTLSFGFFNRKNEDDSSIAHTQHSSKTGTIISSGEEQSKKDFIIKEFGSSSSSSSFHLKSYDFNMSKIITFSTEDNKCFCLKNIENETRSSFFFSSSTRKKKGKEILINGHLFAEDTRSPRNHFSLCSNDLNSVHLSLLQSFFVFHSLCETMKRKDSSSSSLLYSVTGDSLLSLVRDDSLFLPFSDGLSVVLKGSDFNFLLNFLWNDLSSSFDPPLIFKSGDFHWEIRETKISKSFLFDPQEEEEEEDLKIPIRLARLVDQSFQKFWFKFKVISNDDPFHQIQRKLSSFIDVYQCRWNKERKSCQLPKKKLNVVEGPKEYETYQDYPTISHSICGLKEHSIRIPKKDKETILEKFKRLKKG